MCTFVAAGVVATGFLAIWSTRRTSDVGNRFRQGAASEIVWAVIPCLMVLAAAILGAIAIAASRAAN